MREREALLWEEEREVEDRETHQTQDPRLSHSNPPPPPPTHPPTHLSTLTKTHHPDLNPSQNCHRAPSIPTEHYNHSSGHNKKLPPQEPQKTTTRTTRKHTTHWSPPRRSHAIMPFSLPPNRSQTYDLVVRE